MQAAPAAVETTADLFGKALLQVGHMLGVWPHHQLMHKVSCATTFSAALPDLPPCKPAQVARVVSVEALPSSDKLYRTRVQIAGGEERQVTQQFTHQCAQCIRFTLSLSQ